MVEIHSDEIMLLLPAELRLAANLKITARDLIGLRCSPESGTTRARLDVWFEPVESEIQISMELDSTEMIKRFVLAGLGISFLAASNCREE